MTGLQEAQSQEAQSNTPAEPGLDFFNRNLAAIKRWAPNLYSQLASIKKPYTELIVDDDGAIDIGFRGQRLYGQDAVALANTQVEEFLREPLREFIHEPNPETMEGVTGTFCSEVLAAMAEQGIAYDPDNKPSASHFLVVLGVGLGLHLETVVEHAKARVVIIAEPHIEFIYQSLFVTDWAGLFKRGEANDVRFSLIVSQSPSDIAERCIQLMRGNNPVLIDGMIFFTNYHSPILEHAKHLIRKDLYLAVSGLGYFDDEIVMSRNTARSVGAGPVEILSEYMPAREEPLFIVGSGPSVEADLDVIAKFADRAMIMTIGTGLRGALKHGIRPDFHVEIENQVFNANIIGATKNEFDLGGIILVGAVTLQKRLADSFDRRIQFFREGVTPTQIFGRHFRIIRPAGPTVANSGLVSAIRMGFRDVYLFGVDMGTTIEGSFHSKGSLYGEGLLDDPVQPSVIHPANFGGDATGSFIFDWSRKVLENTLHYYKEVNVYNCSNGVRIAHSIPKSPRAIEIGGEAIDRARVIGEISKKLVRCEPEFWRGIWQEVSARQKTEQVLGWIEEIIARFERSAGLGDEWVEDLCGLLRRMQNESPVNSALLGGTLQLIIGSAFWYERRLVDKARRDDYRSIAAMKLRGALEQLRPHIDELYDDMEAALRGEEIGELPDLIHRTMDPRERQRIRASLKN